MKRGNSNEKAQEKKMKPDTKASISKPSKVQKKLKYRQEESSESGETDSDYAEYLRTYDPKDEDSGS
ncbi:hypothetical protein A2U01_0095259, partial [Trifolium medium]|nr:hypothetical protein [Trifolium medium]